MGNSVVLVEGRCFIQHIISRTISIFIENNVTSALVECIRRLQLAVIDLGTDISDRTRTVLRRLTPASAHVARAIQSISIGNIGTCAGINVANSSAIA